MPEEASTMDNPIHSAKDDLLGRAEVARDFAQAVRELDAGEGFVVGVLGPWGSGKSSFVNLMLEQFGEDRAIEVIDFNPWMFSGSEQLVEFFLRELASQLSLRDTGRFERVASLLNDYAGVLSPVAGFIPIPGLSLGVSTFRAALAGIAARKSQQPSVHELRAKITSALRGLSSPIVVVLDDIDRLTTREIRDVFKLARLTASFPNLIYVLAFDRQRVEKALDEDGVPGHAYLEKILQLSFDVPAIATDLLTARVLSELQRVVGDVPDNRFDGARWPDIYAEILAPQIHNLRDVSRFAIGARPTIRSLGNEVEVVDLLAMESIRIFQPELFRRLVKRRESLTAIRGHSSPFVATEKESIERLISRSKNPEFVKNLIRRVFPAANRYINNTVYGYDSQIQWRQRRRLAHPDFLSLYLDRLAPSSLEVFRKGEAAFDLFSGEADELDVYLRSINPEELSDVIDSLAEHSSKFTGIPVVVPSVVLMDLVSRIPERRRASMYDIRWRDSGARRVVFHLLRTLDDESEREAAVKEIIDRLRTYSSQLSVVRLAGQTEEGRELVAADFATRLESGVVDRIRSQPPLHVSEEWDLLRVYLWVAQVSETNAPITIDDDASFLVTLFESARSQNVAQSLDSRAARITDVLAWDSLVQIFGEEGAIRTAADVVRTLPEANEIVTLLDKYLGGWRPSDDSDF
jgi:predicted KAP-like P-loop ATPase